MSEQFSENSKPVKKPKPPPPPPQKPKPPPPPAKPPRGGSENLTPVHEAIARTKLESESSRGSSPFDTKSIGSNPFENEDIESSKPLKSPSRLVGEAPSPSNPFNDEADSPRTSFTNPIASKQNSRSRENFQTTNESIISVDSRRDMSLAALHHRHVVDLPKGEPHNMIYHKVRMSESWLTVATLMHLGQWAMLLSAAQYAIPPPVLAVLLVLIVAITALFIASRCLVKKSRLSAWRNVKLKGNTCTPDDESDQVPNSSVYCICAGAILEGIAYAIFTSVTAGSTKEHIGGYYSQGTMLQILRFASITLLAIHRMLRPANRIDPMRTMLELEVVSVCWDALDGSTLYELIDGNDLSPVIDTSARVLMGFWYLSVGFRMAIMFTNHLTPTAYWYRTFLTAPLQLAPQPTVDRTFQGLRLRAVVIMTMSIADLYAAGLRLTLWARGQLDPIQQDMAIKNVLFLVSMSGAYDMYQNTIQRNWNSRDIGCGLQYPSRATQLEYFRYGFVASYLLVGGLMTAILVHVTPDTHTWVANMGMDILLAAIFLIYCRNVHVLEPSHQPTYFFIPHKHFIAFPGILASVLSLLMVTTLVAARIPAIFYNYNNFAPNDDSVLWTYDNAMLIVILTIVPIGLCGMFWSVAYMLFRREFTASPGNYNAIHDPTISIVAIATMTEGALDILSCATLLELAENHLPPQVNGAIVLVTLLEVLNGCQCFALQCFLSGGHKDTPLDLVRWKAYLRVARGVIDFSAFVLRTVLWIQYNAVSSVFLVKNLYNLMHTTSQIERWTGVSRYPKDTLFSEFVPPADWYGMTKEEWRDATSETVVAQARAGRRV